MTPIVNSISEKANQTVKDGGNLAGFRGSKDACEDFADILY